MVVGWELAANMRTTLVLDALRMALGLREPGADVALVHHSDLGSLGGFNRSSQRPSERNCGEQTEADFGSGWSACDAIAGASDGWSARAPAAVLGGGRSRAGERGCGGRGGRISRGRRPGGFGGGGGAHSAPGPGVGGGFVVRGAGGGRGGARRRGGGGGEG